MQSKFLSLPLVVLVVILGAVLPAHGGPVGISAWSADATWPTTPALQTFAPGNETGSVNPGYQPTQTFQVSVPLQLSSIFLTYTPNGFPGDPTSLTDVTIYDVADVNASAFTPGAVLAQGLGFDLGTEGVSGSAKVLQLDVAPSLVLEPSVGDGGYAITIGSQANAFLPFGYWNNAEGNLYTGGVGYGPDVAPADYALALVGTAVPPASVPLPSAAAQGMAGLTVLAFGMCICRRRNVINMML